jgi:hypothetical protein
VRHGAVARAIAARPGLGAVVGIDPSEVFVQRARTLGADVPGCRSSSATGATCPSTTLPST